MYVKTELASYYSANNGTAAENIFIKLVCL